MILWLLPPLCQAQQQVNTAAIVFSIVGVFFMLVMLLIVAKCVHSKYHTGVVKPKAN